MLRIAIQSVLNQTHREIEVIVVDDGSTDDTFAYLSELSANDNRVKFLTNAKSIGACASRNLAIKQANGEFITGLDDDDEFEPDHIAALIEYWQLLNKFGVKFSALYVNYKYRNNSKFSYSNKISSVHFTDMHNANHVGNQLFSTVENYLKAGLFDEEMQAWQDIEFFYRFLRINGSARLLDINSYVFDITPRQDRISHQNKIKILNACLLFLKKHELTANNLASYRCLIQVFSEYYGFKLRFNDLKLMYMSGLSFYVIIRVLKHYLRNILIKD